MNKENDNEDEPPIDGVEFDSNLNSIVIEGKKNLEEMQKVSQ